MYFSLLDLNLNVISAVEELRFKVYKFNGLDSTKTLFANEMINGKILVYGAFYNNQLIGACYVSKAYTSLFIEQLFVLEEYQGNSLHVGTNLLNYVLNQKEYIEQWFNSYFTHSCLDSTTGATGVYERVGYVKTKQFLMKKALM